MPIDLKDCKSDGGLFGDTGGVGGCAVTVHQPVCGHSCDVGEVDGAVIVQVACKQVSAVPSECEVVQFAGGNSYKVISGRRFKEIVIVPAPGEDAAV